MTRTLGLLTSIVVSFLMCSVARADPGDVAQRCIQAIHGVTQATRERIHDAALAGVNRIERLDDHGASDEELRHAAAMSVRTINGLAEAGQRRVAHLTDTCIEELLDMGARPALIRAVHDAARAGHDAIAAGADRGREAIHDALQAALDD